ncbi:MAG: cytochrome c biogenesis protein ResB [Opitutus sp.]
MNDSLRALRDFFVSLKLTVVLLVFGMLLIFAATLDQVNLGIWAVQEKYFRSFIVYGRFGEFAVPMFPGGYLIGGLLLMNLIAAHLYRFSLSWRKLGIQLAHLGLIILLLGELFTGILQEDFQMRIGRGETVNYAESFRDNELVLIDVTDPGFDEVVAIPAGLLEKGRPIQHPRLPFRVEPRIYYPNSILQMRPENGPVSPATAGLGPQLMAAPQPITYRDDERNLPTAFVELVGSEGPLGTYLVSTSLIRAQPFEHAGRQWRIALRVRRLYQPFSLTLNELRHDVYPGTEIPKNFSSRVQLKAPDGSEDREVLIYMNNPLRFAGQTFYQYQMNRNDGYSVLQVVRNPSWLMPYIACTLMTLGLLLQFGIHLVGFVTRRRVSPDIPA